MKSSLGFFFLVRVNIIVQSSLIIHLGTQIKKKYSESLLDGVYGNCTQKSNQTNIHNNTKKNGTPIVDGVTLKDKVFQFIYTKVYFYSLGIDVWYFLGEWQWKDVIIEKVFFFVKLPMYNVWFSKYFLKQNQFCLYHKQCKLECISIEYVQLITKRKYFWKYKVEWEKFPYLYLAVAVIK